VSKLCRDSLIAEQSEKRQLPRDMQRIEDYGKRVGLVYPLLKRKR